MEGDAVEHPDRIAVSTTVPTSTPALEILRASMS
jgi:hypothetical protein